MIMNPREVFLLRHDKTLYIEEAMVPIPYWDENEKRREPELLHHPTFSRFNFGIINAEGKRSTYHINVSELDAIIMRSRFAYQKEMEMEIDGWSENSGNISPAYTVRFKMGNLKGLTPAEAVAEHGIDAVVGQKDYLMSQTRYQKANASIIKACNDCIQLYNGSSLNTSAAASCKPFPIYKMNFPYANPHRKKNGLSQVRKINITWNFRMDAPVDVNIMECYAPTMKNNITALETPDMSKAQDVVDNHFSLTAAQWFNAVRAMDKYRERFENSLWSGHRKAAEKFETENKDNHTKNKAASSPVNVQPVQKNTCSGYQPVQPVKPTNTGPPQRPSNNNSTLEYKRLRCVIMENRRDPISGHFYSVAMVGKDDRQAKKITFGYSPKVNVSNIPMNREVIVNLASKAGKYCCVDVSS